MEGPEGIELAAPIGSSGRGILWRASRHKEHDRIVHLVDPRFCDERFKHALSNLRQRQQPRMLTIAGEGWSGAHYYIEYEIDPPWQTLEERMAECAGWRDRLALVGPVCDALGLWEHSPVYPLGLNLRNVVLANHAGRQLPWLVPCPAVAFFSPCDLFGLDSTVMAALAPEMIRGWAGWERAQDMYALGTIAAQAVGWGESRHVRGEADRVETQARGALLVSAATASIGPLVRSTPLVERLLLTIRRYRHTSPDARPHDAGELRTAIAAATDPVALAAMIRPTDPRVALEILSTLDENDEELCLRGLSLAAEIHRDVGDWQESLHCLERTVLLAPERMDLRYRRCERWWEVLRTARGDLSAQHAQVLLKDLNLLKRLGEPMDTMPYLCAAEIYLRTGDVESAAGQLHTAVELDGSDVYALHQYGKCWKELKDVSNVTAVVAIGHARVSGMVRAGVMSPKEGDRWHQRFDDLLG
jgi:hypothetical protein